jgi:chondroitin AC lyase
MRLRLCGERRIYGELEDPASNASIDNLLAGQRPDGDWPDVVYDSVELKDWQAIEHVRRLLALAVAWNPEDPATAGNPALLRGIVRGLENWYTRNPVNPNWWWNQIGMPRYLGEVLLRVKGAIAPDLIRLAVPAFTAHGPAARFTGQNLVWVAGIQIRHGILTDQPDLVGLGHRLIRNELRALPDEEGLQPDMSFHQHGKVLYSGGYGQGFACDVARFAWLARDTAFAWPAHKIELLGRFVLDGSRWMVRGDTFDYGASGRELSRKGFSAARYFQGVAFLAQIPFSRQAECQAIAGQVDRGGKSSVEGNRYFWCSDLMTQHRSNYYWSVRLTSNRIENTDWPCCGGEGRLCHHMAEGLTLLFRKGDEYRDIFPVWNWRQTPGTTVEQQPGAMNPGGLRGFGLRSFSGGVSDGRVGCAAMDFARGSLRAHKAWFSFENSLVAAGCGITSDSDAPVRTTINQCHWRGAVEMRDGEKGFRLLEEGVHELIPGAIVRHDGFIYRILTGQGTLRLGPASGSWADCGVESSEPVTLPVFNAGLDHGVRPIGAEYAYLIHAEPELHGADQRLVLVSNSERLQAVWDGRDRIGQAVFYEAGTVTFPEGHQLAVDRGCLAMVQFEPSGKTVITLAEAERRSGMCTVTWVDGVVQTVGVSLPSGDQTGNSIRLVL